MGSFGAKLAFPPKVQVSPGPLFVKIKSKDASPIPQLPRMLPYGLLSPRAKGEESMTKAGSTVTNLLSTTAPSHDCPQLENRKTGMNKGHSLNKGQREISNSKLSSSHMPELC